MSRTAKKRIAIKDQGVVLTSDADSLDFIGLGVSASASNNDVTADISGGGSGSSTVSIANKVTGAIDDSNLVFTFAVAVSLVVVNGQVMRNGAGCSIVGLTVTLDSPVGTDGDIYGIASTSGITALYPAETPDDTNLIYTFTTAPTIIVVNGQFLREGHGFSIAGLVATLDNPVGVDGDIYGLA